MTVTKLWTNDLEEPVEKDVFTSTDDAPNTAVQTILRIGNICNNAHLASDESSGPGSALLSDENDLPRTRFIGQPTDVALLDLLDAFGETDVRPRIKRISELPFSSARKWMGVLTGKGLSDDGEHASKAYIKGAVEYVLARCDAYLTKDGKEVILDEPRRLKAIAAAEKMASEGLRVLGFATGNANTSGTPRLRSGRSTPAFPPMPNNEDAPYNGLTFAGLVGMYDPPRQGVDKAIRRLVNGGVKVMMITGDAETTAVAIGRKLGMPLPPPLTNGRTKGVLKGEDLDGMTDGQLSECISTTSIFARATPEHKMKIVRALQARGEVVAMTGDGVNDAPALKMADIGVAMGLQGTDVAKEAADMILSNDDFSTILAAIEEGKGIFYNIQNFLTFQLSTSVAALTLVLLSTFMKLDNPLNAMQILWISMFPYVSLHDATALDPF
jgi:P-type Ca2+ transporter type 2C